MEIGQWASSQGHSGTVLFEWNYCPNGLTAMGCGMPRNGVARHNTFQPLPPFSGRPPGRRAIAATNPSDD